MEKPKSGCGSCTACCIVLGVKELNKDNYVRCQHLCHSGCSIYENRPKSCRDFECLWLMGLFGDSEELRPDKTGLLFHVFENTVFTEPDGQLLCCYEVWPGAFQDNIAKILLGHLAEKQLILLLRSNTRHFIGPPAECAKAYEIVNKLARKQPYRVNLL